MASKKEITKQEKGTSKKSAATKTATKSAKKVVSTKKEKNSVTKMTSVQKQKQDNVKTFKEKLLSPLVISIMCVLFLFIIIVVKSDKVVITIDNIKYTVNDFNMYAYLVKSDYFGYQGAELSDNILNTQVSNDSDITIGEYLKEQTINKIKISAAIKRIAKENNIILEKEDYEQIEKDKEAFVEQLGGSSEFRKILKNNKTNEESFLEAISSEKLYKKIFDELYSDDKRYDLTSEEKNSLNKSYYDDYVKIKQVIVLKKDLETNVFYDDVTLNQKEVLAKEISRLARSGVDFDTLIKKYSDTLNGDVVSEYYLKEDLNDELKSAINNLKNGDISDVVSGNNAYHVVLMEKLDDAKLNDYYNSKREVKLTLNIADNLNKIALVNSDYLDEITVK